MLSQKGDCAIEPVTLNDDSHPINLEEEWKRLGYDPDFVPGWKPYEARIGQFKGMVDFLQNVICVKDSEKFEIYLERAIGKAVLLFMITKDTGYDLENYPKMVDELAGAVIEAVNNSILDDVQKERQLVNLGNWCIELLACEIGLTLK